MPLTLNITEAKTLLKKDLERDNKMSKDERSLFSKIAHFRAAYMRGILKLLEKPKDAVSLLKNREATKINLIFAIKIFRNSDTKFWVKPARCVQNVCTEHEKRRCDRCRNAFIFKLLLN